MFLRTLRIVGFKSFADRTRLELEPGVTVVVGPNGSGKSNIVDALSWVMGTQATSHLRTQRMEEVIFAGTATRPAHGRAEVSLTFDNAARALPLDLSEVTITRRLFRDGTSEYEINGTPCRLLDINELLSDSGVGRHQHVIVNQGQVAEVLNAGADDHRAVVEEAAGVLKHRIRRQKASRRLERTELDIQRLEDIHHELKRRMRPLKRQAEAALLHDELKARARSLRLYLGGRELAAIRSRLEAAEAETHHREGIREAARRELDGLLQSLGELESSAGEAGRALQRDTAAAARLETTAERLARIAQVAHERRRSIEAGFEQAGARRQDLERELEALSAELERTGAEAEAAAAEAERREAALRQTEDEERSLAEQEALPPEGALAAMRGDLAALEAASDRDAREQTATLRRLEVLDERLGHEAGLIEEVGAEIRIIDKDAASAQEAYVAAGGRRRREQQVWEAAAEAVRSARVSAAESGARVEALAGALSGLSDPGARALAEARSEVVGTVAAKLDVPEDLVAAVEAALGPWTDSLVTADPAGIGMVVGALKAEGRGGVPVVAANAAGPTPAVAVAAASGLEALVEALGPSADWNLAATLLGDVVLAEGWASAWALVERSPGIRAVTPEGDLITAHGIRAAVPDGATHVALEAAEAAAEHEERRLARAESRETSTRRAFDDARLAEHEALEALEELEARLAGSTEALARLERSREQGLSEAVRLRERIDLLGDEIAGRGERLEQMRARIQALEGEEADRQAAWEEFSRRRQQVAERREEARRAREGAAGRLAAATERLRMLEARRQEVEATLVASGDLDPDTALPAHLASVEDQARHGLELVRAHVAALRERQLALRETAGEAGSRLEGVRARIGELETVTAAARDRLAELAVAVAELRVRNEAVAESLRRDIDASDEEALAAPEPELEPDRDGAVELEELQARLARMGPVNPLAAEEYRELTGRHEFLEGQLADLADSRRDLHKVIEALDEHMAELFRTAFADIDRLYRENFELLFPGGNGRLRLTEPDRILTTGIEIEAQPLGKKVSRLSLLSGGERSLAALAFLFAVFRARPSPFYVLDEVEAALDHANLRRFLRLVGLLRMSSQVLIVTHQQQTMEAADILYGVTMEPGGSSQVLAKRMAAAPA